MFLTIFHSSVNPTPPPDLEERDLILAPRMGDLTKVKSILLEDGVDINYFEPWRMQVVMIAAMSGHKEVVEFLVNEGADLSLVDQFGNNILHQACMGGDVKTVKYLLSQSVVGINSKGQHNRTPLMFAILERCHEVMELLVEEGADMSLVDDVGNNVLHCACIGENAMAVNFLLARGLADIHARNQLVTKPPWPAMSPDLNPLEPDWGILGSRVQALDPPVQDLAYLEASLRRERQQLPLERIRRLTTSMRRRVKVVIHAQGGYARTLFM
ncbi:probable palmitoyltransferase AKR2 [Haliotis rubra]|uniref:probable palmitoyltransferase AKR2 n=1 Tax=Haliotis rubra TaxID=36100 RepID=UPI001EE612CE|nr:probable palmitoyltransferase AKR2 [Haliotis rubra]